MKHPTNAALLAQPPTPRSRYKNALVPISEITVVHGACPDRSDKASNIFHLEGAGGVSYLLREGELRSILKSEILRRLRSRGVARLVLDVERKETATAWLKSVKLAATKFVHITRAQS